MIRYIKAAITTALMIAGTTAALAQKVKQATIKKSGEQVPGYTAKYKHSKTATLTVLRQQMTDAGLGKAKKKKGFYVYKGVQWNAISNTKADYYIKVSGNKRKATVYFIASKGYDNYISGTTDAAMAENMINYLTNLQGSIDNQVALDKKQQELDKINQQKTQAEKEIKQLEETKK